MGIGVLGITGGIIHGSRFLDLGYGSTIGIDILCGILGIKPLFFHLIFFITSKTEFATSFNAFDALELGNASGKGFLNDMDFGTAGS